MKARPNLTGWPAPVFRLAPVRSFLRNPSGILPNVVTTPTYPEASVHNLTGNWWETAPGGEITRGRLLRTVVPYPDMKPYRLLPEGRGDDVRQHQRANYRLEEFRVGNPTRNVSTLPVAGLPLRDGETFLVRRGKIRPAVVVAMPGGAIDPTLKRNSASWQYKPAVLMAPYYGVQADGTRAGWNPEFVSRIQRAEYSQYVWDILPEGGLAEGSIMRLDHLFPVGNDPANWMLTGYRLRGDALAILDEWLSWHLSGTLIENGVLNYVRTELINLE